MLEYAHMEFSVNNSSQAPINQNQQPTAPYGPGPFPPASQQHKQKPILAIVLIVFIVIAGAVIAFELDKQAKAEKASAAKLAQVESELEQSKATLLATQKELATLQDTTGQSDVDTKSFQAVFFKDGNVYFGKITKLTESTITLENIYYLNVSDGSPADVDINNLEGSNKQVSLVKLGDELHGPKDVMYIERKEVTFWENLKNDSKIVNAIAEYENSESYSPNSSSLRIPSAASDLAE